MTLAQQLTILSADFGILLLESQKTANIDELPTSIRSDLGKGSGGGNTAAFMARVSDTPSPLIHGRDLACSGGYL